jgi:Fe-S-cluster containining protein
MTESDYHRPERLSFPEDEAQHPWLSPLLDAYHVIDEGIADALAREEKQGRCLACAKGCSNCCRTHRDIPVYPLELIGISWYASEKLSEPVRSVLKAQLRSHAEGESCPFLVDGACSIHPVRPIACRQFNVFGQPCAPDEDPYHTRRHDVLTPIKKYLNEAFFIMLPFYGMSGKLQRRKAIESGEVHKLARVLQSMNWASLADRMDAFEARAQSE